MDIRAEKLCRLKKDAEQMIKNSPEIHQVVVIKTTNAAVYHCDGTIGDTDRLMTKLRTENDKEAQFIVCMWDNYCLDVPSIYFRTKLLELCPANKGAYILLQGENVLVGKRLEATMP